MCNSALLNEILDRVCIVGDLSMGEKACESWDFLKNTLQKGFWKFSKIFGPNISIITAFSL